MKKLKFNEAAKSDLDEILLHIAQKADVETAVRFVDALQERVKLLKTSPEMGRLGRLKGTREVILGRYIVAYRVVANTVEVISVTHGKSVRK